MYLERIWNAFEKPYSLDSACSFVHFLLTKPAYAYILWNERLNVQHVATYLQILKKFSSFHGNLYELKLLTKTACL